MNAAPIAVTTGCSPCGLESGQAVVDLNRAMLADQGFELRKDHKVLEFGCGSGRHVYEWRDNGFDACGFDIADYVDLRDEGDRQYFSFSRPPVCDTGFPSETFDFVSSTSVFEHVMDYDSAFREVYRVLKPGGISIHVFPSRWRPIEPHIFVPFGGRFHGWLYYRLWAALGIRNEYQAGTSARETAERNWAYARTGINYPTKREILFFARRHFQDCTFAEASFIRSTRATSKVSRIFSAAASAFPPALALYRGIHTRVLVLKKTRSLT